MLSLDFARWTFTAAIVGSALLWTGKFVYLQMRSLYLLWFRPKAVSIEDDAGRFARTVLSGEALASAKKALAIAQAQPMLRFAAFENVIEEISYIQKRLVLCESDIHVRREITRELQRIRTVYRKKLKGLTIEVKPFAVDIQSLIAAVGGEDSP